MSKFNEKRKQIQGQTDKIIIKEDHVKFITYVD